LRNLFRGLGHRPLSRGGFHVHHRVHLD
jgi:hypothetical protein